jgi:transcriptional regulator with XRE-family HTH domain
MVRQQTCALPEPEESADQVNLTVCRRLKAKRILENMSQERLARGLGISYQQLQRYESGKSRLPSSMLYRAATVLGVPVGYFFGSRNDDARMLVDEGLDRSTVAAVRNLEAITDPAVRQSLLRLIDQLARGTRTAG